jgi:hypothetical protein
VAGESALLVDPSEIPLGDDVAVLGKALCCHGERDELMANLAAYSRLRWGELAALTIPLDRVAISRREELASTPPWQKKCRMLGRKPVSSPAGRGRGERTPRSLAGHLTHRCQPAAWNPHLPA